jgi:hypothetical protein
MTLPGHRRSLCVNSVCALIALVFTVVTPSMAAAGPSRLGPTFDASGAIGSVTTDIAYDPANDVYLLVSGPLGAVAPAYGRFVKGDGAVLGAGVFRLAASPASTQQPRVAYSAAFGGFLVTWIDNPGDVWARFIRYSPGGPEFATGDLLVERPIGGVRSSTSPAVVCAGAKPECLLAWHQYGIRESVPYADIHAVRIGLAGERLGTKYFLTNDGDWQDYPAVSYDPAAGIYAVAHTYVPSTSQLWVHRIEAGSGTYHGHVVLATGDWIYKPEIAFNSASGQFLVTYYEKTFHQIYGRFMKSDGTPTTNVIALLGGYSGLDSNSIAYNAISGSFLGNAHGNGAEDVAYEVSGTGNPSSPFLATDVRGPTGAFYPRAAAHSGRKEWMMAFSANHAYLAGQRITTDTQGPGNPGDPGNPGESETIDLTPTTAPNGSWFLAEGVAHVNTATGFITFYLIVNENPEPVNVRAYFANDQGKTRSRTFTVAANSRATLNLLEEFGPGTFGAVFQSLTPGLDIFVERSIYWNDMEGSTAEVATKTLASEWYFGEGSRDFFSNYFLVFNPTQTGGSAGFTFYLTDGTTVHREVMVGPQQRVTLDASTVEELAQKDFGVRINTTVPMVAERAMYFFGPGADGFIGGTATIGTPALSTSWAFAEGSAAAGFDTFYLLMNPNPFPITVTGQFFPENGARRDGSWTVAAGSRRTIYLNVDIGDIGDTAAQFTSASPFVAERSIYWGAAGWIEGTNAIGSANAAAEWHIPEGTETGIFDSYMLIFNPTSAPVTVDVTVYIESKGRFTAPVHLRPVIQAQSRATINMWDFLTAMENAGGFVPKFLAETSFSTKVRSTQGEPIVVEHALYRTFVDGLNRWRTGSASFGVPR